MDSSLKAEEKPRQRDGEDNLISTETFSINTDISVSQKATIFIAAVVTTSGAAPILTPMQTKICTYTDTYNSCNM